MFLLIYTTILLAILAVSRLELRSGDLPHLIEGTKNNLKHLDIDENNLMSLIECNQLDLESLLIEIYFFFSYTEHFISEMVFKALFMVKTQSAEVYLYVTSMEGIESAL